MPMLVLAIRIETDIIFKNNFGIAPANVDFPHKFKSHKPGGINVLDNEFEFV